MSDREAPEGVDDFIWQFTCTFFPDAPDLALASFNEKHFLETAVAAYQELQTEVGHLQRVVEFDKSVDQALVERVQELENLFEIQWKSDMRAITLWQEAHPGNDLVWPDKTKNTLWLLEQIESLQQQVYNAQANVGGMQTQCDHQNMEIDHLEAQLQQVTAERDALKAWKDMQQPRIRHLQLSSRWDWDDEGD